jgi:hypothetical protein
MDNVQKVNNCINVLLSQIFKSYLQGIVIICARVWTTWLQLSQEICGSLHSAIFCLCWTALNANMITSPPFGIPIAFTLQQMLYFRASRVSHDNRLVTTAAFMPGVPGRTSSYSTVYYATFICNGASIDLVRSLGWKFLTSGRSTGLLLITVVSL